MIMECVIFKIEVNRKETVSKIKKQIWEFTDSYGNVKDVEYKDDVVDEDNNDEDIIMIKKIKRININDNNEENKEDEEGGNK